MTATEPELILSGARALTGAIIIGSGTATSCFCCWKALVTDSDRGFLWYLVALGWTFTLTVVFGALVMSGFL